MKHSELRQLFLDFFEQNGHLVGLSAPLASSPLTSSDDTPLFTSAGMQPLVKYLSGKEELNTKRLTNSQMCLRTNDIHEVGDATHLTFFEMLGSWSFGDYSKKDAIKFAFDFLSGENGLNLPQQQLWVTVFEGGEGVPRDDEAAQIWEENGMPKERIAFLPAEDNWWSMGEDGLCGPDTEIFYDTKWPEPVPEGQHPGNDPDGRFVEIWNSVFMSYDRKPDGSLEELPVQNVDQGAGLERMLAVLNGTSIYETDCFAESYGLLKRSVTTETASTEDQQRSLRIIADHMRSILFILSEKPPIYPSNQKQGYVLKHLIRNAATHAHSLGIDSKVLRECLDINAETYKDHYEHVAEGLETKKSIFSAEQERFEKILNRAPTLIDKFTDAANDVIPGDVAYKLVSTHGIPLEIIELEAGKRGQVIDMKAFAEARQQHVETSKQGPSDNAPKKVA